jgi:GTP1/Obg family GTP-binding protein
MEKGNSRRKRNRTLKTVVLALLSLLLTSWLGWHVWVTTSIYGAEKQSALKEQSVKELKEEVKVIQEKLDTMKDQSNDQYKELLKLLLQIQGERRKKEDKKLDPPK